MGRQNLRKKVFSYLYSIFTWNVTHFYISPLFFQKKGDMYKGVVDMQDCKWVV